VFFGKNPNFIRLPSNELLINITYQNKKIEWIKIKNGIENI